MTLRAVMLLTALVACGGGSAADQLASAQTALSSGDYAGAVAAADAGLAAGGDATTTWRLEVTRLEAQARAGDAEGTAATLQRLAGSHAAQATAALYVSTADQLAQAKQGGGSVKVLDAGLKRFPDDADLARALDAAKKRAGNDSSTNAMLETLGYLDK